MALLTGPKRGSLHHGTKRAKVLPSDYGYFFFLRSLYTLLMQSNIIKAVNNKKNVPIIMPKVPVKTPILMAIITRQNATIVASDIKTLNIIMLKRVMKPKAGLRSGVTKLLVKKYIT